MTISLVLASARLVLWTNTHLADVLKHLDHSSKVADVEDREDELDVRVVPNAVAHFQPARRTRADLVRRPEPSVEHPRHGRQLAGRLAVGRSADILGIIDCAWKSVKITLRGLVLGDGDRLLGRQDGELDVPAASDVPSATQHFIDSGWKTSNPRLGLTFLTAHPGRRRPSSCRRALGAAQGGPTPLAQVLEEHDRKLEGLQVCSRVVDHGLTALGPTRHNDDSLK